MIVVISNRLVENIAGAVGVDWRKAKHNQRKIYEAALRKIESSEEVSRDKYAGYDYRGRNLDVLG